MNAPQLLHRSSAMGSTVGHPSNLAGPLVIPTKVLFSVIFQASQSLNGKLTLLMKKTLAQTAALGAFYSSTASKIHSALTYFTVLYITENGLKIKKIDNEDFDEKVA